MYYRISEEGNLHVKINGDEKLIAETVGQSVILSADKSTLVYLAEKTDNRFWDRRGNLYIDQEGNHPVKICENVAIIEFSNDLNRVLFMEVDKYLREVQGYGAQWFERYVGKLYILQDYKNLNFIDDYVDSKLVFTYESPFENEIIYFKTNPKSEESKLLVSSSDGKEKIVLREKISSGIVINKGLNDNLVINHHNETFYYRKADKILETKKLEFLDVNKGIENDLIEIYFTQCPSKKYYIANELAKKAHKHIIIENDLPFDDSINHIALYKREQIEEVLEMYDLLMKTPVYSFKIFGFHVNDILPSTEICKGHVLYAKPNYNYNEYMLKENALLKTIDEIRQILMKHYNFKYRSELEDFLIKRYILPLRENSQKIFELSRHVNKSLKINSNIKEIERIS